MVSVQKRLEQFMRDNLSNLGMSHMLNNINATKHTIPSRSAVDSLCEKILNSENINQSYKDGAINALRHMAGEIPAEDLLRISAEEKSVVAGDIVTGIGTDILTGERRQVGGRVIYSHGTITGVSPSFNSGGWSSREDAAIFLLFLVDNKKSINCEYNSIVAYGDSIGNVLFAVCDNKELLKVDAKKGFCIHVTESEGYGYISKIVSLMNGMPFVYSYSVKPLGKNAVISVKRHAGDTIGEDLSELAAMLVMSGYVKRITK